VAKDEPIISGVAGRYASALFDLAQEEGKVSEVEWDLDTFQRLCDASPDLVRVVRSPVIPADEQSRALTAVLERAGVRALTQNFFKVIAKNRRLFAASEMVHAFRALAAKARGQVTAEVISAHPLTDSQARTLTDTLRGSIGKDILLERRVDPSLLGGLVIKVGSRMVDTSLKTKLASLRFSLRGEA
jgi:F-type H+-transporting ATPase subunit delta